MNKKRGAGCSLFYYFLLCLFLALSAAARPDEAQSWIFNLPAGNLDESLKHFSAQCSLQLLYEHRTAAKEIVEPVVGEMTAVEALTQLLHGTDLSWRFINPGTVAITSKPKSPQQAAAMVEPQQAVQAEQVTELTDVMVTGEQPWWNDGGGGTVVGFPKPLLETPRSVSFINGDAIDLFSLSVVEDLLRVVPGVFTTTRFGVQGSVDIRNIAADTYFRGMKRLTLQGHGRSVMAAMDSIEVVGGPASPLHGIGKIGGYVNVVPKSGRSRTGQYMPEASGFSQLIVGEYERRELSFGIGGPVALESLASPGGYYLYGLLEDSDSYAEGVPVKQKVLQAAASFDDVAGPFRLETGFNVQQSRTAGALTGRLTQDLVSEGRYIGGSPLVNLDLNGDGTIGYLEMHQASPAVGALTAANQPLQQTFSWPTDADGKPLANLRQLAGVSGIPQALYDYLQTNPEADPTGALRAQGVGGPLPMSGYVPVGMALDPRTVSINTYNPRRNAAFERDLEANFLTLFADLVYDRNPDFTVKNQLFYDSMDQYKSSNQPFSQIQDVKVLEDKFTVTKRALDLPDWVKINQALSLNARYTISKGNITYADYGNHRTDATSEVWNRETAGMTPNTTFTSANEDSSLNGLPWVYDYRTEFSEVGGGLLFDVDLWGKTNIVAGARYDLSAARNTDYAGRFETNAGTSEDPGTYLNTDKIASAKDSGGSWSLSVSQQMPWGLRPYGTLARSAIILDGNNNSLLNVVIDSGHLGAAELKELGLKGSWLDGALNLTTSVYEQGRVDVSSSDDPNIINAYASATTTRGWQTEIKWAARQDLFLSLYALRQTTRYTPNIGGAIQVDARAVGFTDIYDDTGNLIYPAEAFLYGGRVRIQLPNDLPAYERKQGNPRDQIGFTAIYRIHDNWGATFKGNYLSSTCAGRICLVELPSSLVFDVGLFWSNATFDIKLDVTNITDEHYFRARTGDVLGDVIAQPMPGRQWLTTIRYKF